MECLACCLEFSMSSIHVVSSEITGALQGLCLAHLRGLLGISPWDPRCSTLGAVPHLSPVGSERAQAGATENCQESGAFLQKPGEETASPLQGSGWGKARFNPGEASLPRIQLFGRSARLRAVPVAPEGHQTRSPCRSRSLVCRTRQNEHTGPSLKKCHKFQNSKQQSIATQHGAFPVWGPVPLRRLHTQEVGPAHVTVLPQRQPRDLELGLRWLPGL